VKPGDLVLFSAHTGVPFERYTDLGVLLSTRITKWNSNVTFYKFLTPSGVREVILGVEGSKYEVLSETR
jgi:hypothetical protein